MNTQQPAPAAGGARHAGLQAWGELLRTRWVRAVLVVELLLALAVVVGLWTLRRQTLDSELRNLASLSAAMAAQADGSLDLADAALRATREELAQGLLRPGDEAAHAFLRARAVALPRFRALAIVDEQGLPVASSNEPGATGGRLTPVADRDYFIAARQAAPGSLFVGSPGQSRFDGLPAIGLSMDWRDGAGRFKGAIVLVADPEFLDGGFDHIAPSPDTSLALYRRDRELVSDGPGDGSARLLPASVMNRLWIDPAPARPRLMTLPDRSQRLVAAHPLRRYPLLVVITRDVGAALVDWTEQAWLSGSFAASALIVTLVLTLRNGREQALHRATQAALVAEQERAVRAFQAAQEGHWEWNPLTREIHLSPRMKELLGIARDGPPSPQPDALTTDTVHPDDLGPLRAAVLAHQAGRTPVFDCSFRVRDGKDGWRHVRARGHALRNADGQVLRFSGTAADVTDEVEGQALRQQLQDQLQRARKLEALGTLAGGVAHDFNNILASVIGYGELARSAAADGSNQARQLDHVMQAGQRGKALVERILSFSRGAPRPHTVFLIQPVVDEVLQLLQATLPESVRLDQQLQAQGSAVRGDPTLVYEAVMNLCTNAVQAMPQGGTLQVRLSIEQLDAPKSMFENTLAAGRYACVAVSDSGAGIAPDVMARLFEPFFTTKGRQQGTGLGLAVVHGVVSDLGGAVDVFNVSGQGARFVLYFPCVDALPDAPTRPDDDLPQGQGQHVLVVDDEPALVELTEELLAGLGYEAFGVVSSQQALERFRHDPDRFALVLTDELMPAMTGTELATALHALRPTLPIVLVSAYGGPQLEQRAAAAGVTVLLNKPLARAELARALAQALRAPSATRTA